MLGLSAEITKVPHLRLQLVKCAKLKELVERDKYRRGEKHKDHPRVKVRFPRLLELFKVLDFLFRAVTGSKMIRD